MNTRPEPPDWAEDAPELFTDRDKLARAMRAASIAGNIQRCNALKARADVLRAERAEEIAKADDETLGRIVKDKPEAAEWLTRTFLENSKTVTQAKRKTSDLPKKSRNASASGGRSCARRCLRTAHLQTWPSARRKTLPKS